MMGTVEGGFIAGAQLPDYIYMSERKKVTL